MNLQALRDRYLKVVRSHKRPPAAAMSNHASAIGDPCLRRLVLLRTNGHQRAEVSDYLQGIFDEGDAHERAERARLEEMGVYMERRSFPKNSYEIAGTVDGDVEKPPAWLGVEDHGAGSVRGIIVEIKSLNDHDLGRLEKTPEAEQATFLRDHHWMCKWYAQGQVYCFLADRLGTLFVFRSKQTGRPVYVWCPVDLQFIEGLLDRVQTVNDHLAHQTLPDYISDTRECKRCPFFGRVCTPSLNFPGEGHVETDEAIVEAFEEWARLKAEFGEAARMLWKAEEVCKDIVKARTGKQDGMHFFCGPVIATTKLRNVKAESEPRAARTDVIVTLTPIKEPAAEEAGESEGVA